MSHLFSDLLVSSPYKHGGLYWLHHGQSIALWPRSTMGLWYNPDSGRLLFGIPELGTAHTLEQQLTQLNGRYRDLHDLLEWQDGLYLVSTLSNTIVHLANQQEQARWVLAQEPDARHVNCLGVWNNRLIFSAFGDFTETRGWKGHCTGRGYVQDLYTGERLIEGLSAPHSLLQWGQNLLIANSEAGEIHEYNPAGQLVRQRHLGPWTRGICIVGNTLYVGTSQQLEAAPSPTPTTLYALDAHSWAIRGQLELPSPQIYAVVHIPDPHRLAEIARIMTQGSALQYTTLLHDHQQLTRHYQNLTSSMAWRLLQQARRLLPPSLTRWARKLLFPR